MKYFSLVLILGFCLSCNYSVSKMPVGSKEGGAAVPGQLPGFQSVSERIFQPNCVACHSGFSQYANVKASLAGIRDAVSTSRMPKNRPPLSAQDKEFLFLWIDGGAPETAQSSTGNPLPNPPAEPGVPDNTQPPDGLLTFDYVTQKVIGPKCLMCHSEAGGNKGKLNLETYAQVYKERREIGESVVEGWMPRGGSLAEIQKYTLLRWIEIGAPK